MKECVKCNQIYPLDNFYKVYKKGKYRRAVCKNCYGIK